MNVITDLENFNLRQVFCQPPVKNTVMEQSEFTRFIYSNALFVLNAITLRIPLGVSRVERAFNKYKCFFDRQPHSSEVAALIAIEQALLAFTERPPKYVLAEQLRAGFFKCGNLLPLPVAADAVVVLSIYGIWDNGYQCGLTYRINATTRVSRPWKNTLA